MQTYLGNYGLYDFNWQKMSKARYMAKNFLASQKYQKHDKSNVEHEGNASAKG